MKRNDHFWKQHKAFFVSRFHSDEDFLHVEKLAHKTSLWSICEISAAVLLTAFVCWVCFSKDVHIWFAILFLTIFLISALTYYTSGLLSQENAIITTKAVYYCRGKDCDLVFEFRYADMEQIQIVKNCVTLISNETYNNVYGPWGIPNTAPLAGRWNFLMNRVRRLFRTPTKSKLFRFTKLCVLFVNAPPRQYFLDLDLTKDSQIPNHIKKAIRSFPQIKLLDRTIWGSN